MIEARGRTGRKPTASEKSGSGGRTGTPKGTGSAKATTRRVKRYELPPTWKSALWRGALAAAVVYVISTLLLKKSALSNIVLFPIVLLLYTPMIYYTDLWMYRRAQRKKAAGR
jgi:hypothetical protein